MRLGVIARDTLSGLGSQTLEVVRNLDPAVVVVIEAGVRSKAPSRPDWYPDALRLRWERDWTVPGLFEAFRDCEVVYSAESFYDPTVSHRLAEVGVGTVLHVNPELYDRDHGSHWAATLWTPTGWWPTNVPGARVVPMPCPVDRFPEPKLEEPLRIVHPTAYAMADRNGTQVVRRVERRWQREGWTVDLVGPGHREIADYWDRDPGAAVSVIPRRYGGQCLPALEALSAGVPVVMPDCPPNDEWPTVPIPARLTGSLLTKGGRCHVYDVTPDNLWRTVRDLCSDRERLDAERLRAREWAEARSWAVMAEEWWRLLAEARL